MQQYCGSCGHELLSELIPTQPPVFTQAMAEAGEFPSIGASVMASLGEDVWFKFRVDYIGQPVVVVAAAAHDDGAAAFVASLRAAGYRIVERTRKTSIPASTRAVVLWEPPPGSADELVNELRDASPDAEVLVYSTGHLKPRPKALVSNSPLRLRGDLADLAEGSA